MLTRIHGVIAVLVVIWLAALAGCSPASPGQCAGVPPSTVPARPLVLVVGAHAGSPSPGVPAVVIPQIDAAILGNQPLRVVRLDGQPEVIAVSTPKMNTVSCEAMQRRYNEASTAVFGTVRALSPKTAGADPWSAINQAVSAARTMDGAKVIVIDSLLSDTGPIDTSTGGVTTANPDEVASHVARVQKVDLAGVEVELVGVGETAAPQTPLSPAEKATLSTIWVTTLTKANAKVTLTPTPRPGAGPTTNLSVRLTPVADIKPFTAPIAGATTTTRYPDSGPLRFATNSDQVAEREAAMATLAPVADWLVVDPSRHLAVHGRTDSSGTSAHNRDLATRRAQTIADMLRTLRPGITARQITTFGDATDFADFIPDRAADGTLDPIAAAQNRSVVLTATATTR